jgi:hypothetical protein
MMTGHTGNEHELCNVRFAIDGADVGSSAAPARSWPPRYLLAAFSATWNQTWFSWLVCSVFLMIFIVVDYW